MKIRGVWLGKETRLSMRRMQKDLFEVMAKARSREELQKIEPMAQEVHARYMRELKDGRC